MQEADNILPCCVHFCEDCITEDAGGASLDETYDLQHLCPVPCVFKGWGTSQ